MKGKGSGKGKRKRRGKGKGKAYFLPYELETVCLVSTTLIKVNV